MAVKHEIRTPKGNGETRILALPPNTMRNVRPSKARFRELIESKKYAKDFNEFKADILSIKLNLKKDDMLKCPSFFTLDVGLTIKTGWMHPYPIGIEEIQAILKKGNINDHWVMIPENYSDFKKRWEVDYLFDPGQSYPKGFNPIDPKTPVTRIYSRPQNRYNPYKVLLEIDIRYSLKTLVKYFKQAIRNHKSTHNLRDRRAEKYNDEEVYRVQSLLDQGMNPMNILKILYPEHKEFSYKHFIETPYPTLEEYEAASLYKRILRITQRLTERKSKTV